MKQVLILCATVFLLFSCQKDKDDKDNVLQGQLQGQWNYIKEIVYSGANNSLINDYPADNCKNLVYRQRLRKNNFFCF